LLWQKLFCYFPKNLWFIRNNHRIGTVLKSLIFFSIQFEDFLTYFSSEFFLLWLLPILQNLITVTVVFVKDKITVKSCPWCTGIIRNSIQSKNCQISIAFMHTVTEISSKNIFSLIPFLETTCTSNRFKHLF